MEVISKIVEKMIEPIIDRLYTSIGRQFSYLVHCKKNIKDFADEVDKLRLAKGSVETKIDAALSNAEVVIEDNVSKWLTEVQSMEEDKNRLLQAKDDLRCLDVCSRYQLGKEGKRKKPLVTKLIEDGNFDSVAHRPLLTNTWHRSYSINYESFQSRELVFEDIMKAIKDDMNYKIGIHGMPGVGKTRMMKEVAQRAQKDKLFDEIVEIVVTLNPILKDIQLQLAEGLNLELDKDTEYARKGLLCSRLKNGKKILVMVDDVWNDQIKLEDMGIPATDDQTKGCKILLTSRKQDVCKALGVPENDNFQIGVLSEAEAWSLFQKKVGDSFQPHEMRSVAEAVCEECAGLPLAILAVGGALMNQRMEVWKDALTQLRNSTADNIVGIPGKLYSRIELSYNYLQQVDAKSFFLLCCLFPEDAEVFIDDLVRYGFGMRLLRGVQTMEEARNRAHVLVATLKTSSLLLEGRNENFVKMHDVIRDVAISIASKEEAFMYLVKAGVEKWPEEDEHKGCKAISLRLNKNYVLPDDSKFPELRTLMLEGTYPSPEEVPSSFFEGMEKLEVLHLRNIHISALPASLKYLRVLSLHDNNLENLAFLGELKKLEILSIKEYFLRELTPEIGHLTHLRLLDLSNCINLQILSVSVISSLSRLEELYFPIKDGCTVEGNASLVELNSLTRLISLQVHVSNVTLLPLNELLFKSLIRFQISIGCEFINYYISRYQIILPTATRILILMNFSLKRELSILIEKAEVLFLFKLKGLKDVFHNREAEGFLDLKYLEVKGCDEMKHLFGNPKWISQSNQLRESGSFSKLICLEVANCKLMIYLFSAATAISLSQLQKLIIRSCEIMEEIVRDDEEVMATVIFNQLKKMELRHLPNLKSFCANMEKMSTTGYNVSTLTQALFNDKVRFPALEELKIRKLKNVTAIWDNQLFLGSIAQDSFQQLRIVTVRGCEKLVNVIPLYALPWLQNLESLEVVSCDSVVSGVEVTAIEEGGDEILMFPQLKYLKLKNLPNLRSFCYNTAGSKQEEEEGGGEILVFPQLNTMRLEGLPKLSSFRCSRRRGEERIQEETSIPQPQAPFNHEETSIPQPQAPFNHKVKFPCLEDLYMKNLDNLGEKWHNTISTDSVSKLRKLELKWCHKLLNVASTELLTSFQNLEEVKVLQCDSMQEVFKIEGSKGAEGTAASDKAIGKEVENNLVFPRLNSVVFTDLPCLMSFCGRNCISEFPSTLRITVERCPKLEMFPC